MFPFLPNYDSGITVTFTHATAIDRGRLGDEKRRSTSAHLLRTFQLNYHLQGDEAQQAREYFDQQTTDLEQIPDWTAPSYAQQTAADVLTLTCNDHLDHRAQAHFLTDCFFTVNQTLTPTQISNDQVTAPLPTLQPAHNYLLYPARTGRITRKPNFQNHTDDQVTFSLTFQETPESINEALPWDLPDLPLEYLGRKLFLHHLPTGSHSHTSNLSHSQQGFGIDTPYQREAQAPRKLTFDIHHGARADIYHLIAFFDHHRGRTEGFWMPSDQCNYRLATDAPSGATTITIAAGRFTHNQAQRTGYTHLYLTDCPYQGHPTEITNVVDNGDGTETLTLAQALPKDFASTTTALRLLYYVRFASDELKLTFDTDIHARGTLAFIELPREYQQQELGLRPAFLYHLTGHTEERWTSFGKDLLAATSGQDYQRADITHSRISYKQRSLQSNPTVTLGLADPAHPLNLFRSGRYPLEPLSLTIYRTTATAPDDNQVEFAGPIREIQYGKNNQLTLTLGSTGDLAETEVPTSWAEPRCSRAFGREGCNLDLTPFRYLAALTAQSTYTVTIDGAGAHATGRGFTTWFVNGLLTIDGQTRTITDQTGDLLALSTPLVDIPIGSIVTLTPGCPRTILACRDRFNNLNNFGGAPGIPKTNPQLEAVRIASTTPNVGKK